MKILSVHAHPDDFEFTAAGTFSMFRKKLGDQLRGRILVCTDGKAGHHFRTREETGRIRRQEQEAASQIGGFESEFLVLPDGQQPREGCLQTDRNFLAALWKAIRDFEPDYIFCPPYPSDPLVGVHADHWMVAEAVRKVAYFINVPHAFTPEYPASEKQPIPCRTPVILNVYDGYMGPGDFHLAVNISAVFDEVCKMTWAHQSQVVEWIPWVARHDIPATRSFVEWSRFLKEYFAKRQSSLGLPVKAPMEVFTLTSWGRVPTLEQLQSVFSFADFEHSKWNDLRKRLK